MFFNLFIFLQVRISSQNFKSEFQFRITSQNYKLKVIIVIFYFPNSLNIHHWRKQEHHWKRGGEESGVRDWEEVRNLKIFKNFNYFFCYKNLEGLRWKKKNKFGKEMDQKWDENWKRKQEWMENVFCYCCWHLEDKQFRA